MTPMRHASLRSLRPTLNPGHLPLVNSTPASLAPLADICSNFTHVEYRLPWVLCPYLLTTEGSFELA